MKHWTLEVGTVPDREKEVVWIWVEDAQLGELSYEDDRPCVALYGNPERPIWDLSFGELASTLQKARLRLEKALGVPTHCQPGTHTVRLASSASADRQPLVVEIWLGRIRFAELSSRSGNLRIAIACSDRHSPWEFSFSELLDLLNDSKLFLAKAMRVPAAQLT